MVEDYLNVEDQEKKKKKKLEVIRKKQSKEAEIQSHLKKNKLSLNELQDLVKEWVISFEDKETLEKISQDKKVDKKEMNAILDNVELQEILQKIEEMEKEMDINDLLPKAMRVKKEDFVAACTNATKKAEVLQKIDDGIDYVMFQLGPKFKTGGNPFARRVRILSNMLFVANKKVIRVQEHMIDLKHYLHSKA